MPKISVIVPIYNVEEHLDRSIQSIINQKMTDIEIILINDGSLDNSLSICKKYRDKDSRIKLFDKNNGGVSSARNLGIQKSNGDFLAFVDHDDWIEEGMMNTLYLHAIAKDTDIAICNYKVESEININEKIISHNQDLFTEKDILEFLIPNMIGQD